MTLHQIAETLLAGGLDLDTAIDLLARREEILRWFSTDCVQRVLRREEQARRLPPPEAQTALAQARKFVLGEVPIGDVQEAGASMVGAVFVDQEEAEEPLQTLREMAWLTARDSVLAMANQPLSRKAAHETAQEAANEAAWAAMASLSGQRQQKKKLFARAQGEEFSWQCRRLAYLCEVWATCGDRAPRLLYDGHCPLPAPPHAQV